MTPCTVTVHKLLDSVILAIYCSTCFQIEYFKEMLIEWDTI